MTISICSLAKSFKVREILRSPARTLVSNESVTADIWNVQILERRLDSLHPCLSKLHAADARHDVDAIGRQSELRDRVNCCEISGRDSQRIDRCAKGGKRIPYPPRIVGRRVDPDVEIYRRPWDTEDPESVSAHHQKSRVGSLQFTENIAEIFEHRISRAGRQLRVAR